MKTFIVVIIFGILTYAFTQDSPENKKCHHEAMENFNSEKYFSIHHAYVTHAMRGRGSNFCRELSTTKHSNGTIVTIAEGYEEVSGQTYYSKIFCIGTPKDGKQCEFSQECNFLEDTKKRTFNYNLYTSVIDTDYEKYAIIYRCTMMGTTAIENILVLQTDKNANNDKVKQSLERKKGLQLDTFISRNNEYCNSIPNKGNKEEEKKET